MKKLSSNILLIISMIIGLFILVMFGFWVYNNYISVKCSKLSEQACRESDSCIPIYNQGFDKCIIMPDGHKKLLELKEEYNKCVDDCVTSLDLALSCLWSCKQKTDYPIFSKECVSRCIELTGDENLCKKRESCIHFDFVDN